MRLFFYPSGMQIVIKFLGPPHCSNCSIVWESRKMKRKDWIDDDKKKTKQTKKQTNEKQINKKKKQQNSRTSANMHSHARTPTRPHTQPCTPWHSRAQTHVEHCAHPHRVTHTLARTHGNYQVLPGGWNMAFCPIPTSWKRLSNVHFPFLSLTLFIFFPPPFYF